MTLRELVVMIGLDFDQKGADKAEQALHKVKNAATALVGVFVASRITQGLHSIVYGAVEAADQVQNLSDRLGVNTQALQELSYAAEMADVGQEGLATALQYLERHAAEAAGGSKEAAATFAQLGVSIRGADGHVAEADVLLRRVADGLKATTNDADRLTLAMKLFGRGSGPMIQMLKDGSAGLDEMGSEARELGAVMGDEFIGRAGQVDDSMKRLRFSFSGLRNVIAEKLMPAAEWLNEKLTTIVQRGAEALKRSKLLEMAMAGLTVAATVLGVALSMKLLSAVGSLIITLPALAAGLTGVGNAALIAQLKAGAALIALAVVIALIADEIWTFFAGGETVMGKVGDWLTKLYDRLMKLGEGSFVLQWLLVPFKGLAFAATEVWRIFGALLLLATGEGAIGFKTLLDDWAKRFGVVRDIAREIWTFFTQVAAKVWEITKGLGGTALRWVVEKAQAGWSWADRPVSEVLGGSNPTTVPASSNASTSSSVVSAPQMTVNQTVVAAPGQSVDQVGAAAGAAIRDEWDLILEDAEQALTPAYVGG